MKKGEKAGKRKREEQDSSSEVSQNALCDEGDVSTEKEDDEEEILRALERVREAGTRVNGRKKFRPAKLLSDESKKSNHQEKADMIDGESDNENKREKEKMKNESEKAMITCPICSRSFRVKPGQNLDQMINMHIEKGCQDEDSSKEDRCVLAIDSPKQERISTGKSKERNERETEHRCGSKELADGKKFFLNQVSIFPFSLARTVARSLPELLGSKEDQRRRVKKMFVTSGSFDPDFFFQYVDKSVNATLVKHWCTQTEHQGHFQIAPNFQIVHPPLLASGGTCHAKMILIAYSDYLRVIITSANFISSDWDYLAQVIWYQDFPKKVNSSNNDDKKSDFQSHLFQFIMEMMRNNDETSLDEKHIDFLKFYDFSSAKVDFIYSVPGYHSSTKSDMYGYKLLSSQLKKHFNQLSTLESNLMNKANLLYQTSAVGILNPDWLKEFQKHVNINDTNQSQSLKIMFPSKQAVSESILGNKGAGTIFFPKGAWEKNEYKSQITVS